jgi:EmrB/QacA subfamily drug resistance transporter
MTRRQLALLVPPILTTFMAIMDVSVVSVVLPKIQADLGGGVAASQWVLDVYTLMLCGLSLSGGAMADRYGRKRLLMIGIVIFTAGSVGCALSVDLGLLIASRAVQGVGAAVLIPGTLSIVMQCFPEPVTRAKALGLWSTIGGGLSFLLGPTIGGLLADEFGWASIFWINLPIGLLAAVLAARILPESADPAHAALDPVGQLLTIASLSALAGGLIEASRLGWRSPPIIGLLAGSVVGLVALVLFEARHPQPMLPVRVFRERAFALVSTASFVLGFGAYGIFFFLPEFFQSAQGHSAAGSGLLMLPMSVSLGLTPLLAGRWVARSGPIAPMFARYLAIGTGLVGLVALSPSTGPVRLGVLLLALGSGMGLAITSTSAAGLTAVGRQRSGIAGGVISTGRQCGQTVGVALLGSLIASRVADPTPSFAVAFTDGLRLSGLIAGC